MNKVKDNCIASNEEILTDDVGLKTEDITPRDLLKFARQVLLAVYLMFVFGCIAEFVKPGNSIFEICKTTLPSVATLVIGYYFGSSKS